MTLEEIRIKFRDLTGRFDLVDPDDDSDNGANFLIQSAVRMLDRLVECDKAKGRYPVSITAGDFSVSFAYSCRAITEVWCLDSSSDGRWQLEKRTLAEMMSYYSDITSEIDTGQPVYYAPALLRPIPDTMTGTLTDTYYGDFLDLVVSSHWAYNGIIFGPPSDNSYVLDIHGLFGSNQLSDDDDQNYWSIMFPDLLILATQYQVETQKYRNSQGAQDYLKAILEQIRWITADSIEQEIAEYDQMEG